MPSAGSVPLPHQGRNMQAAYEADGVLTVWQCQPGAGVCWRCWLRVAREHREGGGRGLMWRSHCLRRQLRSSHPAPYPLLLSGLPLRGLLLLCARASCLCRSKARSAGACEQRCTANAGPAHGARRPLCQPLCHSGCGQTVTAARDHGRGCCSLPGLAPLRPLPPPPCSRAPRAGHPPRLRVCLRLAIGAMLAPRAC